MTTNQEEETTTMKPLPTKDRQINFRVTEKERKAFEREARREGKRLGAWVRDTLVARLAESNGGA